MKVKHLLAILAQVDQELDVAVVDEDHEYWGRLFTIAEHVVVEDANINGPKRPGQLCLTITG